MWQRRHGRNSSHHVCQEFITYRKHMQEHTGRVTPIVKQHTEQALAEQQRTYNHPAQVSVTPGPEQNLQIPGPLARPIHSPRAGQPSELLPATDGSSRVYLGPERRGSDARTATGHN